MYVVHSMCNQWPVSTGGKMLTGLETPYRPSMYEILYHILILSYFTIIFSFYFANSMVCLR